ncbi:MAG: WD40 repeat domain-containing protein, partial [Thermoflexibacteraceae bacterium]
LDKKSSITIWDIAGKKVVKNVATDYPIGAFILHQHYFIGADKGGNIVFWDLENIEKQPAIIYRRYASPFYSIAYSDKGKHLVAGNSRGEVLYFQFNPANFHAGISPNLQAQIFTKKHLGVVASTTFSQDGNNMASAGLDGIVMLWDLKKIEKGKIDRIVPVRMDSQNQKVFSVAFDQHGKHVVFGGLNQLHIRPINIDQLYQKLRGRLENTELAEAQWTYFRRGDLEKPQRTTINK